MINREDMLELTRRMTLSRTSMTRIAGCYVDKDGDFDGSFNVNFLNLSQKDKAENLEIAKAIPFSRTNQQLKKYEFKDSAGEKGNVRLLLEAIKDCGLKNDALMDTFYDLIMERYTGQGPYAVLVFHDRYDVPRKGTDKERQWESEEVYEYLIGAVCPLEGEYQPGSPKWGFLYPAFTDRSSDQSCLNIFHEEEREVFRRLDGMFSLTKS